MQMHRADTRLLTAENRLISRSAGKVAAALPGTNTRLFTSPLKRVADADLCIMIERLKSLALTCMQTPLANMLIAQGHAQLCHTTKREMAKWSRNC
jgi:hypothetical protein